MTDITKMDEYSIRLAPKPVTKRTSVFKLHKDDNVSWNEAKMKRENEYQPWQIKLSSGKVSRRFKAIKEGGISENASYFVFYKTDPNSKVFEACPIDEFYAVQATQRFKTLTAEEAERKFEQRHKMFNMFSVMELRKNGEDGEDLGTSQDTKGFKVSELDEWDRSGDDEASADDADEGEDSKRKVRRKKGVKKEEDAPAEAKEESDEGDYEEREVDYMSDSSSSDDDLPEGLAEEKDDVKGIAEEGGLRDLLSTDDEEEDNAAKTNKQSNYQNGYNMNHFKTDPQASGSDDTSDSDDFDVDDEKMDSVFDNKKPIKHEIKSDPDATTSRIEPTNSRNNTSTNTHKRKNAPESVGTNPSTQPLKRPCTSESSNLSSTPSTATAFERTLEGLIVKYLSRKPMTLRNLLKDIMSKVKKMDASPKDGDTTLVATIAGIIKRLDPDKESINGTHYLSIKRDPQ